jgi:hypothetical protein
VEPSTVVGLLGALGVGSAVSNWITNWLNNRRQRIDRQEERGEARDEAHREMLRLAYAEFIAAYSTFLDAGGLLYSIGKAIHELPGDVYERMIEQGADPREAEKAASDAVAPDLRERGKLSIEEFAKASDDANTKAVAVLLIDDDAIRRGLMMPLVDARIKPPQANEDDARFLSDLERLRKQLDELTTALAGCFSPDRWHAELAERRALSGAQQPRLPPKSRG